MGYYGYEDEIDEDVYAEWGSRDEYLAYLAEEYGLSYTIVSSFAEVLGPSEDFDGLVTELEDQLYYDQF